MKKLLVTGSSGLIGSEVCIHFASLGWEIHGIDNNQREIFFGPSGTTRWNESRLKSLIPGFLHYETDIRQRDELVRLVKKISPTAVVHTAAQPSHDKAAFIPFEDFDTNAVGTFNLLEAVRRYDVTTPFVHMSTNKVYGDAPNEIALKENTTRWEFAEEKYSRGISEELSIDQCKHSLFGASKLSADISVQEYGRYFGMPTVCLRGGCLTGPNHSGVELHGFLSYLIKCNVEELPYKIYGYKGKQVRDNIHSFDVARFIEEFINTPRVAEVYNLGGGKDNTCSILEAFELAASVSGRKMLFTYDPQHRTGDHICYYSDLTKIKTHYPKWTLTRSLKSIFQEIHSSWIERRLKMAS